MQTFVAQATVAALQEGGWVGLRDAMAIHLHFL